MDFKIMSIKRLGTRWNGSLPCSGFTLTEVAFTVGITALCLGALAMFFVFSTHSFRTLYNYVDLDDANRLAMDQLTRDVRQAKAATAYTTNSLTLQDADDLSPS